MTVTAVPTLGVPRIHPSAIVEEEVELGAGTVIWDSVHIRRTAIIGEACSIGEKTYIAYGVQVGSRVKINAFVYLCAGVTIEDGVLIGAGAIFTNDHYPRATTPDLEQLRSSAPGPQTRPTLVREGASIGAGSVIGSGLVIGRFAMLGMGSVVTTSIADFALVMGNPARSVGYVCRCGVPVLRFRDGSVPDSSALTCESCGLGYHYDAGRIYEAEPAAHKS